MYPSFYTRNETTVKAVHFSRWTYSKEVENGFFSRKVLDSRFFLVFERHNLHKKCVWRKKKPDSTVLNYWALLCEKIVFFHHEKVPRHSSTLVTQKLVNYNMNGCLISTIHQTWLYAIIYCFQSSLHEMMQSSLHQWSIYRV